MTTTEPYWRTRRGNRWRDLRGLLPDFVYLTGVSSRSIEAAAGRRHDLGLLITPNNSYLSRIGAYPKFAVDNGVFSKSRPFVAGRFLSLLDRLAAMRLEQLPEFVVAPDVVCDCAATLAAFPAWQKEISRRGFPVALAAQDGLELRNDIPWAEFSTLFMGGSTAWKEGQFPTEAQAQRWDRMLLEAHARGKKIHFGRVNSSARMDLVSTFLEADTADGTFLGFGPDKNLPRLERWLDLQNYAIATAKPLPLDLSQGSFDFVLAA